MLSCHTAYALYYCNMVGWTWWDWSLILSTFRQCIDTVGWVIWSAKPVPDMTYNVFGGTLNLTQQQIHFSWKFTLETLHWADTVCKQLLYQVEGNTVPLDSDEWTVQLREQLGSDTCVHRWWVWLFMCWTWSLQSWNVHVSSHLQYYTSYCYLYYIIITFLKNKAPLTSVSYTHLTLPTIYSV